MYETVLIAIGNEMKNLATKLDDEHNKRHAEGWSLTDEYSIGKIAVVQVYFQPTGDYDNGFDEAAKAITDPDEVPTESPDNPVVGSALKPPHTP